ncbi:hypothetical protein [Bacillus cereus]|uniref:hypothetical protein n=1 Tax=Bacillus cereus TaxID=1396 RepID=UPI001C2CC3D7|nr:hypothetical protein [Bacillus cereus]
MLYDDSDKFIIVMDDATWENARTEGNRGIKQRYSQKQMQQLLEVIYKEKHVKLIGFREMHPFSEE